MHEDNTTKLNVSLEPHLLDALRPLPDLLPTSLADELMSFISDTPKDTIPYSTLLAISQWSRSPDGKGALASHVPSLNASSYSMISLLAGVKTSPERNFGVYEPPPEPRELAMQQTRERREITAILNALLSVFGVGLATWWAADILHWKDQWRVLLALSTALLVAIAEGGLFLIWRSRKGASGSRRRNSRRDAAAARHKKIDDDKPGEAQAIMEPQHPTGELPTLPGNKLRQRRL